ncbi:class I SAM-dependent methyltransferase [Tsukamurella soli]|uniref:Methyltransferase n=1 Tax=Tsukamurella soli TaxID=644556 RepID=A0ABP8J636_9ACTN
MPGSDQLTHTCRRLRPVLLTIGFSEAAVRDRLGPSAAGAVMRGEPGPVLTAAEGSDPLDTLIQLFVAHARVDRDDAECALAPVTVDDGIACGLLEDTDADEPEAGVRAALGIRPLDTGDGVTDWLVSDLDGRMRPRPDDPEQVMGVGHASLSLLRATPTDTVGRALDLGTGCGVQAVAVARRAGTVVATDLSERAVRYASASAALSGVDVELRRGPWFLPVRGELFDLIVANPPFVVGAGAVDHIYRDSGLDLDGASELVVRELPDHLAPGGTAAVLASWVHREGEPWPARVSSWLPADGVEAWVLQRDIADPALYVGTWLRDEGLDPRIGPGRAKSDRWLQRFAEAGVTGVGFGFVYVRAAPGPSSVVCEELAQPFDDPLGPEATAHFVRMAYLRRLADDGADLAGVRLRLAPDVALERVSVPDPEGGWSEAVVRVTRMGGPRWSHEIDDLGARLLAGCSGALPLGELVDLLEAVTDVGPLLEPALALATDLFRHGFLELAE